MIRLNRTIPKTVIEAVGEVYDISYAKIVGYDRTPYVSEARHVVMHCLIELGYSYSETGRILNKDHSSVIHAVKKWKHNKDFINVVGFVLKKIGETNEAD